MIGINNKHYSDPIVIACKRFDEDGMITEYPAVYGFIRYNDDAMKMVITFHSFTQEGNTEEEVKELKLEIVHEMGSDFLYDYNNDGKLMMYCNMEGIKNTSPNNILLPYKKGYPKNDAA